MNKLTTGGLKGLPTATRLFMERFEEKVLQTAKHKPTIWYRYVDDNFVVLPHSKASLEEFLHHHHHHQSNTQTLSSRTKLKTTENSPFWMY